MEEREWASRPAHIRKHFHIPSFREGATPFTEFRNGWELEQFMFGFCSSFEEEDLFLPYGSFDYELNKAIDWSVLNKKIYKYLSEREQRPFCCYLYDEIKSRIPNRLKSLFRMYITVGTLVDLRYSTDMVFFLGDSFVTIDVTGVPSTKRNIYQNHFLFSPYQLTETQTAKFAKKVAEELLTQRRLS